MCGIVAAIASQDVLTTLIEGLQRLEYRGYDSAGVALLNSDGKLTRVREVGKVAALEAALALQPASGKVGIAHTRWATHGRPSQSNAHPHVSGEHLAVVHNGIIENHEPLRQQLRNEGYTFTSETDTEVVAHLVAREFDRTGELTAAVQATLSQLEGAYALAVMHAEQPDTLVGARKGSPLVVGLSEEGYYLGSDPLALLPVTRQFHYLKEGDVVSLTPAGVVIHDEKGQVVTREVHHFAHEDSATGKAGYRHFMLKEIFEQPKAVADTLSSLLGDDRVRIDALGPGAAALLDSVKQVHIVACGTSYHAGQVARYWLEELAGIPCQVEVASEYRYRQVVVQPGTLFLTLSQSGETADTLAALRFAQARQDGQGQSAYLGTLAICNVPGSSLVRESDLCVLTKAGPEIGVASTKAFTTQLAALMVVVLALRQLGQGASDEEARIVAGLKALPEILSQALHLSDDIAELATKFVDRHHTLFLGRGKQYPIAMEGALKLKEISYIHAEAYAAGELKHGPLALIDEDMPIVAVAPNCELIEKLKSNLQEVRARGGELFIFADPEARFTQGDGVHVMTLPICCPQLAPILYTLPLQLLSYHVAVLKGTDVDQPRNLAKSVTVE
ncbi:glutamine--fructose-6-phosphate transaminase (isomerizing) [Vreelandella profundi]|uniref:glutamine--fructose-6-phosphate transaminase (isomerizing) n=1 Tax=Vreelandella profundi TaxID=2852117 RepID=UPI001F004385|nr:glutamine--fructose-6-phosphate transaminase (isomerizing) [Halomonas profundi]